MRRIFHVAGVAGAILVVALLGLHVFTNLRSLTRQFNGIRQEGRVVVRLYDLLDALRHVRSNVSDPAARSELIATLDTPEVTGGDVAPLRAGTLRTLHAIGSSAATPAESTLVTAEGEVRAAIRRLEEDVEARTQKASSALAATTWHIGLGVLGALIATAAVIFLQQKQVSDRDFARTAMAAANEELRASLQQARERSRVIEVLGKMGELLQISANADDVRSVVDVFGGSLFRDCNGAVYAFGDSRETASLSASWGSKELSSQLTPADCWGLRRGTLHVSEPGEAIRCRHASAATRAVICVPMLAQGETTGVLAIELPERKSASEQQRNLAKALGDQLSLTISNLKLKESLRALAIRDGLTGLYNRRYMEESLTREFRRAKRHGGEIAVFMVDIDHFKNLNDTYGHAGGDLYLQEFARLISASFRAEDIVCRYGGEEFAVILPDPSELDLRDRAEKLRQDISRMEVRTVDGAVINTTVSIGIAVAPRDGMDSDRVLGAADRALYKAKRAGRNRVIVSGHDAAEPIPSRPQVVVAS